MTLAERWKELNLNERFKAIASEVKRAEIWEEKDEKLSRGALERALELVELSLDNPINKDEIYPMLVIRERLGELYVGLKKGAGTLYAAF